MKLPPNAAGYVLDPAPEPAYLALLRSGELERRVDQALAELESCRVCPRKCQVDRLHALPTRPRRMVRAGRADDRAPKRNKASLEHIAPGTSCFSGRYARVASAFPHRGEEDCLRGTRGSGTIFFSFCNLRCVFCQNWDTSQAGEGVEVAGDELASMMLELQAAGCHNINFVTPEHVVPQMLEGVYLAALQGLKLPIVYNTSAYDTLESLRSLDGVVDIYMPDFKVWEPETARKYLKAEDYPDVARKAVKEMHRQVGPLCFDRRGLAVRGVLVRHLVMPEGSDDTRAIFKYLADEVSPETYVNVMGQYYRAGQVAFGKYPEIGRKPQLEELSAARRAAREAGLTRLDTRWL